MFSRELIKHIKDNTKGYYERNFDQAVDAFNKSLYLVAPREDMEGISDLVDLLEAKALETDWSEIKIKTAYLVLKYESYLKFLLGNIKPDEFKNGPKSGHRDWMLESLLKDGFKLVPENISLSSGRPYEKRFPFRDQYLHIYKIRNVEAHCYDDFSHEEIFAITRDILIIYLDAAYKNAKAIELLYQKYMLAQSFHAREYCKRIKEEYEKQIKTGFFYVDIKWKRENDDIQISSIERIRINANSHLIKIVGEAGSGKTTALQRLAYLDAKNYLKTGRGAIPIYISLKELEEDPTALPEINAMIARALNISQEDAEKMLSHGECTLLLDGYNEILTNRLKRQFATSIKNLTSKYDDISIILTDRAIMKNAIRVMSSAEKYCLYPLDREMKAEFIKLTCRDETARHILLSKLIKQLSKSPPLNPHGLSKKLGH